MASAVKLSLMYSALPAASTLIAGIWAIYRQPGSWFKSGIQHFAAGLVFSVVAVELLPDVIHASISGVMLSFAVGAGLMLLEKLFVDGKTKAAAGLGFLFAVAADELIDGILIGTGLVGGKSQGKLLAIALGVEGVTLGLATATVLVSKRSRMTTAVIVTIISLFYIGGALLSTTLMAGLSNAGLAYVLSFGSAALLYLVTEELLIEAHQVKHTPWSALMFFVSFAAVELLHMLK